MEQHIAVYLRVSTAAQSTRSQEPDLKRWAAAYAADVPVRWYRDKVSGKTMDRPAWCQLEQELHRGAVLKIVVWRVDRLGRTASGLTALFEDLQARSVGFVSVREGLDLETPAGRLMATVLAGVASYEREVRGERQAAGIAAARAAGKSWGGRRKGDRYKITTEVERQLDRMLTAKEPIAAIARVLKLSRPTIYAYAYVKERDGVGTSSGRSRGRGLRPA
jgi:DNA invertase Pin-like site-specific DNA recombinase